MSIAELWAIYFFSSGDCASGSPPPAKSGYDVIRAVTLCGLLSKIW